MPPKFGGAAKCPRCDKSVYMAEEIVGAGKKWHKSCFTCKDCNKRVDSTTVNDKEGRSEFRALRVGRGNHCHMRV